VRAYYSARTARGKAGRKRIKRIIDNEEDTSYIEKFGAGQILQRRRKVKPIGWERETLGEKAKYKPEEEKE